MPFIGAAILPHSPLLLPAVGGSYAKQTRKIRRAIAAVAAELYALQPETIIVLHPHGPTVEASFVGVVAETLTVNLSEFGDLVTKRSFRTDVALADRLHERAEDHRFPYLLRHDAALTHDVSVPLILAADQLPNVHLVPVVTAQLDPRVHVDLGRLMAEEFHQTRKRVFVIASGELSSHVTDAAPGGARPEGTEFDRLMLRSLSRRPWSEALLRIDPTLMTLAECCGYRPFLILAGIIARQRVLTRRLAYDSPFGIGLLVATFHGA